ncbi:MAG: ABC transporter substrate-binding protein [Verrucomicrobia bacterium]|nr:ABC transporter substrate-binding protein [Verrucomicrobiota bacterium]MBV8482934.1 ABC transporter substrate-binding protein [Verrucomicrobiota bacterium]
MEFLLGHSPDPDDAFMFYALAENKIDTRGHTFHHTLQDIETLNQRAGRGELHISAVSIHAYAYLTDHYALLPCGASMGDGYGPMLVSTVEPPRDSVQMRDWLSKKLVAVPGLRTSAHLALKLFGVPVETVVVPFDQIFDYVRAGKAEVGLLIHEGQLTYAQEGFHLILDLGQWWKTETGLPLPLGGNVIRKDIPPDIRKEVSEILKESIRYGLENRLAGIKHSMPLARGLDLKQADKFIGMYVNDYTLDYGETGREAIRQFLRRGKDQGILPSVELEFVE